MAPSPPPLLPPTTNWAGRPTVTEYPPFPPIAPPPEGLHFSFLTLIIVTASIVVGACFCFAFQCAFCWWWLPRWQEKQRKLQAIRDKEAERNRFGIAPRVHVRPVVARAPEPVEELAVDDGPRSFTFHDPGPLGMNLRSSDGAVRIIGVSKGGAACEVGLVAGTSVLSVNGTPSSELSEDEVRQLVTLRPLTLEVELPSTS